MVEVIGRELVGVLGVLWIAGLVATVAGFRS